MSNKITINIRMSTAARFTITSATPSNTIMELKEMIAYDEGSGNCPVERQRLIYKGRILSENTKTLQEYGINGESEETVHLVKGSVPRNNPGNAPQSSPQQPVQPQQQQAANPFGMNPFASMGQGPGMGMNMNLADMQSQLLQNPEMMQNIMQDPMVQSMMNNPDFIRSMMDSNPQMRQLMESNPELRHMLDDPELMRRSMEMMRDPSAMQNMMRNQDLALSQIENIPGGFSALRRMYEDVQAPMMDAMANGTTGSESTGTSSTQNSENQRGGAMPNPWATNSSLGTGSNSNIGGSSSTTVPSMNGTNPFTMMGNNPWANSPTAESNGGMPGMNSVPNIEQTLQMLENPMMNQMMNNLMSNPEMMQNIMNNNPMLRQLRETNPQVAAMMSNPEMMRSMLDPNFLRSMMQMQNNLQSQGIPGFPSAPMGNIGTAGDGPSSPSGLDFSSLLNQMQSASIGVRPSSGNSSASIPPEQRFRVQLQSLNDMGFDDNRVNIPALQMTHGNVNRAIDLLLTNPPAPVLNPSSTLSSASPTIDNRAPGSSNTDDNDVQDTVEKDATEKKND